MATDNDLRNHSEPPRTPPSNQTCSERVKQARWLVLAALWTLLLLVAIAVTLWYLIAGRGDNPDDCIQDLCRYGIENCTAMAGGLNCTCNEQQWTNPTADLNPA